MQPPEIAYTPPRISRGASRAGWLMVGMGIVMLMAGGFFAAIGYILPNLQLPPEQAKNLHQLETQLHASFKTVFVTAGGIVAIVGVYHIGMGLFVRKGSRAAVYAAIVTSFLAIGWCVVSSVNGLMYGAQNAAAGVCFLVVIGAAFLWLLVWLFQALRGVGSAGQAQFQAQYWQMLRKQQAFGQPTGAPPPPAAPLPPLPEPLGWAYAAQTFSPPPPPPPPPNI